MKEYVLVAKFSNGEKWAIPFRVIARHKANALCPKDVIFPDTDATLDDFCTVPDMAVEWLKEKMDWEDVRRDAYQYGDVPDYEKEFEKANLEIKTSY